MDSWGSYWKVVGGRGATSEGIKDVVGASNHGGGVLT